MEIILEKLKSCKNRESTVQNYLSIWRQFNSFVIKLDRKPEDWEDRVALFCAYLINKGRQSATIKSYVSAIKCILVTDGYNWSDSKILLTTLVRSCRLVNDTVQTRLPIRIGLLEIILREIECMFSTQYYLEMLYKNIFILGYYGLLRIGELVSGNHTIKARDVHVAQNKDKIMLILYTSKTHGRESRPQKIKISANKHYGVGTTTYCPFELSRQLMSLRGAYKQDDEPYFIFRDQSHVAPHNVRQVLKEALISINLDPCLYVVHGLRSGRASDLVLKYGKSVNDAMKAGRWRSNAVFRYIHD